MRKGKVLVAILGGNGSIIYSLHSVLPVDYLKENIKLNNYVGQ